MLASILDRLTSLVSKYLVIGFFVPVLMFSFITGLVLYYGLSWFREWARPEPTGTAKAFDGAVILVGLSIVAYLFSSISTFLREILEGKHIVEKWSWLRRQMQTRQQEKLNVLDERYANARAEHYTIAQRTPDWQSDLSNAANEGENKHGKYSNFDNESSEAARTVKSLLELSGQSKEIPSAYLQKAVSELVEVLKENDESVIDSTGAPNLQLRRFDVLNLIDYAEEYWRSEEFRNFNERQSRFGGSPVAPTAMGNVAQTMQAYALTRYHMNLEKFWGNLQAILPDKARDFYAQLQDAKTQLDFLVTCCWLSFLVTGGCVPILLVNGRSPVIFLTVALGGPIAGYFFYFLGVKNYQGFAELIRIGVDLYRFQLLDSLHVPRPRTARDEPAIWKALQRLSYTGGEETELSYKADATTGL